MPPGKSPRKKQPRKKAANPLEGYRHKRNFEKTPEPGVRRIAHGGMSFVIQEHHARSHHFDFRLEMDGVLVSWAVPKGFPEDLTAKRLAVHVENHPLEYGQFEGVIPKGNYGAGTVAIWDKGEWQPLDKDWRKSFKQGKLKFALNGMRAQGEFLLARMEEEPNWLLRKLKDDVPVDTSATPRHGDARFVSPQLARVAPSVPEGSGWFHEIKFDGYRLIAVKRGKNVRLFTRNELDWTHRFKALAEKLSRLTAKDFVLDGEAVVLDGKGRSSFGALQAALRNGEDEEIRFVAFDLLHHDGVDLRELPLSQRMRHLVRLMPDEHGPVFHSKVWEGAAGKDLFKQACQCGLEGIISKRSDAAYREAQRRDWFKCKCRARQEFVVCGYTKPKGSLPGFGALLLASFENDKLIPRGKVGTGFSDKDRLGLLDVFKRMRSSKPHWALREPGVTWIEPRLVAEVEFAEITTDGSIRQGSFVAMREDKAATDVHLDAIQKASIDPKGTQAAGIVITHAERLVYPSEQITKLEVARYYERVGDLMLPFIANRPLAVLRAPDGLSGPMFFQKSFENHLPVHVRQTKLEDGAVVFSITNTKGLVSLAQFGVIEIHPWGARIPTVDKPDILIWDLDPDEAVPWVEVLGAALLLRDFLAERNLATVVKTSGGKGLHVMLYIKRGHDWEIMRNFTKAVAQVIADHNPKRFTITASKSRRKGRIFIDWMRNTRGATCVAPWSLRARTGAAVSMPVAWEDLRSALASGFTIRESSPTPIEWLSIKPQAVSKAILRELLPDFMKNKS